MAVYISTEHLKCFELFVRLVEAIPKSDYASQMPVKEALVEFDRYRVWSGNIGAGHRGKSYKRSLDYRLREASFYKEKILRQLTRLRSLLEDALEVVQGVRIPQEAVDDPGLDSEAGQGSESDSGSDWAISSVEEEDGEVPLRTERDRTERDGSSGYMAGSLLQNSNYSELPQILSSIRITITSLYKMPVRRPAPVDRLRQNDEYADEKALYTHFDVLYVQDLFKEIEPVLATKLGRQITRRRQLLHYRSSHNEDLKREIIESVSGRFSADKGLLGAASDAAQAEDRKRTSSSQADDKNPKPSIKASTFNPKDFPSVFENHEELDIQSEPETVSSFASTHTAQEPLVIPPRPLGPDGVELQEFECSFCCILTRVRTAAAWKKHVLRDLEPYVCTFRDCEQGDRLFDNRDEWYEHELQQHRMEYTCNTEGHEPSDDRHAFSMHMKSLHGAEMDSSINPAVFDMFLHPSRRRSGTCPLCGALATKLKKHLSHHLDRIALFALPRNQYLGESDGSQFEKSDVSLRLLDGSAGAKSDALAQFNDGSVSPSEASSSAAEDVESATLNSTEELDNVGLERPTEAQAVEETVPDTAAFSWDFATDKFKDARADPEVKQYGLSELYCAANASVDIVFVHGLNGHPYNTWADHDADSFWPADLLPLWLNDQKVRILTYGYYANIEVFMDGMSKETIHFQAETLANKLVANRSLKRAAERPLIFICHSLGGLLVKRCLIYCKSVSHAQTERLRSVYVSTYAILFLGTPHTGSDLAKWATILKAISAVSLPRKSLHNLSQLQLVQALATNNETLQNINRLFFDIIGRYHVYFFHETKPSSLVYPSDTSSTSPFVERRAFVVDEDSAAPSIEGVERVGIESDHMSMCKFKNEDSSGFDFVVEAIDRYSVNAPKSIQTRWMEEKRIRDGERRYAAQELFGASEPDMTTAYMSVEASPVMSGDAATQKPTSTFLAEIFKGRRKPSDSKSASDSRLVMEQRSLSAASITEVSASGTTLRPDIRQQGQFSSSSSANAALAAFYRSHPPQSRHG